MNTQSIVTKVWSFCTTLRDDGVGYGDYLTQITYLIFLKMADEYSKPPYNRDVGVPEEYNWKSIKSESGAALEVQYVSVLRELAKQKGMLSQIFTKAQNQIQDPAKLKRLIDMIDGEKWVMLGADVKGNIYEGILERNAEDTKSGAGQYFTPRALIATMVKCMKPEPKQTIADPACGTGGFFLSAYDYLTDKNNHQLDKEDKAFLKNETFFGNEIVANTRRLCLMNMFLHNIGEIDGKSLVSGDDALIAQPSKTVDMVLANPPFGKKSSMTFTNEEGEQETDGLTYNRQDFWATTSNKQVNFVQHIRSMLRTTGRAAVVLPDNVLFEGGAGETVRKKLMESTELHTILRLPTGIFYANGVKANVLFFDNQPAQKEAWTKDIWIYDYRTNVHHTLKKKPMTMDHLEDFVKCYNPDNRHDRTETWNEETNPDGRWRKYTHEDVLARDKTSLDIFWLKDKSLTDLESLPEPDELAEEIIENMEAGLDSFRQVLSALK
ncbi:type I restriction-modification system subunit M [Vibrio splendidus]|uniref:class I SAM-dependent DNA methyltransferase n=1 Tax=Vibrio splendidus TaxID=29497 RepID=UPI002469712D|nr:class I SAM-dependent DNA methyltransferase [Vibrio splendidus]MDH5914439.1 type I restriction-modification system subunit M [Vibrio splendidus]MDH5943509.1 type I restriction-modification system subunit M [Vibrio splendidus]MDH5985157.1 type I restriction-modification system subunit M [Vibrio splendidus]MDH5995258.1 type I restriction-modification system subunit M [Vibrio splendidus]MDH6006750.1 type I restriction-modification system subunit M [Vibrio splendidus]